MAASTEGRDAKSAAEFYGYLFDESANPAPTPMLTAFLKAIALYIVSRGMLLDLEITAMLMT